MNISKFLVDQVIKSNIVLTILCYTNNEKTAWIYRASIVSADVA